MIKQILLNEIKDCIGHTPSQAEYKSALEYLSLDERSNLRMVDISVALNNWCNDYLEKCEECGNYFLPSVIEEREIPWDCFSTIRVCSDTCYNDYCQYNEPETPEISQHI